MSSSILPYLFMLILSPFFLLHVRNVVATSVLHVHLSITGHPHNISFLLRKYFTNRCDFHDLFKVIKVYDVMANRSWDEKWT